MNQYDLQGRVAVVTGGGRASGTKVGGAAEACCSASKARRHRNSRLECRPCRRATSEAVVAGSSASARMARFCSGDQLRRVPATMM